MDQGVPDKCSGATINYQGGGSGQGVTQFTAGTVDFAGSDFPLSAAQKPDADKRCGSGNQAIDIPMVPGPIAVAYNVPGVTDLKLSASMVAKIFSGKITKWNDAAIKSDNPSATLPVDQHPDLPPVGRLRHHLQLHQLPVQRRRSRTGPTASTRTGRLRAVRAPRAARAWRRASSRRPAVSATSRTPSRRRTACRWPKLGDGKGNFVALTADNTTTFLSFAKVVRHER